MTTTQAKRKQIVYETIKYYVDHDRAWDEEKKVCRYKTFDGRMCAFARCMKEAVLEKVKKHFNDVSIAVLERDVGEGDSQQERLDSLLKPEYQGHSYAFWTAVQHLHDDNTCWYDANDLFTDKYTEDLSSLTPLNKEFNEEGQEWADRICSVSNDLYEDTPLTAEKEGAV